MLPLVISSASIVCLIPICLLVAVIILRKSPTGSKSKSPPKGSGGSGGSRGPANKTTIPFDNILTMKKSPWNTQYLGNKQRLSVSNGVLRMKYVKNQHGATSGAKISALPAGKFPAEKLEFGYDVYFPENFGWVKGGKLPGVCIGVGSKDCATGGDWKKNEGSARFMWRSKDGKNAYIIGYLYLPVTGNFKKAYDVQGAGYKKVTDPGNRTGHDLWHGELPIKKGGWNSLRMKLQMNTPGKADGVFEIQVNEKTRTVNDVMWRDNSKVKITNMNLVTFFGGGSSDWDSKVDTYTEYKNFWIA
jgi:hypothetical protein